MSELNRIPRELRNEPRWVNSKPLPDGNRIAKPPYCSFDPTRLAKTNDRTTWSNFEAAEQTVQRGDLPWVGFVLGDGYIGVDLDECRDPETGVIEPWAVDIIDQLNSYTEASVSLTGVHIICKGILPGKRCRTARIEMYDRDQHLVMTGTVLRDVPVEPRSDELAALYRRTFGTLNPTSSAVTSSRPVNTPVDLTDDELLERVSKSQQASTFDALWRGETSNYPSPSEADLALCRVLAFWTANDKDRMDRLFRRSGLVGTPERLEKWNRPKYRTDTLNRAVESTATGYTPSETGKDSAKSTAVQLVEFIESQPDVELFQTDEQEPFISVAGRTMSMASQAFQKWAAHTYYNETGRSATVNAIKDAVAIVAGGIRVTRDVYIRVAAVDAAVYVDLGDAYAEVTACGWRIVQRSPVPFIRPSGFRSLPHPERSSEPLEDLLRTFVNITNDDDLKLVIGWLVCALRGKKPYTFLNLTGEQGAAKSTAARYLQRLIDPQRAGSCIPPERTKELMVAAHNAHLLSFENLTKIDWSLSDALCALSTGGGNNSRSLYSDRDAISINRACPVLLNGISNVVRKPDLQERTITVTLEPIPGHQRKTESELDRTFTQVQPRILGRLLDAIASALKNDSMPNPASLPRMADFAKTVTAAESGLGWEPGTFQRIYDEYLRDAMDQTASDEPLVTALHSIAPFTGTADELLRRLRPLLDGYDEMPRGVSALGAKLRAIQQVLRHTGLRLDSKRTHRHRLICISAPPAIVAPPSPAVETRGGHDSAAGASVVYLLNQEKKIEEKVH